MTRRRRRWRRCVLWRCVAPSATSPPGARQCAGAGGSATRSGPRHHPQTFLSRCQAATPPAARAVLLTPGGPRVLWTAAGVQLQRRAAAPARPSTSRRRARAAAKGAAEEPRGRQRRPHGVVARGTPGSSRSRHPRAARPLAGGRGRYARPGRGRQGALRHGRSQGGAGVCFATVYPLRLLVRGSPAAPPGWPAGRSYRRRAGSILG